MRKTTLRRFGHLLIVALISGLVAVPVASAQESGSDPSAAQYDAPIPDPGSSASSESTGDPGDPGDPGGLSSNIGSLPFTGMDLLIVVGVALVLTGTGLLLRRLSTPRGPFA